MTPTDLFLGQQQAIRSCYLTNQITPHDTYIQSLGSVGLCTRIAEDWPMIWSESAVLESSRNRNQASKMTYRYYLYRCCTQLNGQSSFVSGDFGEAAGVYVAVRRSSSSSIEKGLNPVCLRLRRSLYTRHRIATPHPSPLAAPLKPKLPQPPLVHWQRINQALV